MLIFISGGVRSGKSTWGEKLADSLARGNRKIYLATARCYDEEISKRIEVHRQNRAGKSFLTLEKSRDIGELAFLLEVEDTVIIDCLGTLLANEMFESEYCNVESVSEKIFADLELIQGKVSNLIIISNEVFSDGVRYPELTESYIKALAGLHIKLAEVSDVAMECLYSCYQCQKGETILQEIMTNNRPESIR